MLVKSTIHNYILITFFSVSTAIINMSQQKQEAMFTRMVKCIPLFTVAQLAGDVKFVDYISAEE